MAKRLMAMLLLILAIFMVGLSSNVETAPAVPAVYLFGDSIFDVGTNNLLPTKSDGRADKPFYGIDSPNSKPTGRFSNGYNTADHIVKLLGYKESPPPFLYLVQNGSECFNTEILKGVNFASGGSGLLNETGAQFGKVISMAEQIQQFTIVRSNISQHLNDKAEARIKKSLFLLSVGSNDILEFFQYNISKSDPNNFTRVVHEFLTTLISQYRAHLKNLINLGARKFGILSVPPIGCIPIVRVHASDQCAGQMNFVAQIFNPELEGLLQSLSMECPDFKYSFGKSFDITNNIISNSSRFGLNNVTSACCGNKTLIGGIPCSPDAQVCQNRSQFLFWDQYHPTEYASKLAASSLYNGGREYVAPTNFSVLVLPSS